MSVLFSFLVYLVLHKKKKKKERKKHASKRLFISLCIADSSINQLMCRIVVCVPTLRSLWFEDPYISISPIQFKLIFAQ